MKSLIGHRWRRSNANGYNLARAFDRKKRNRANTEKHFRQMSGWAGSAGVQFRTPLAIGNALYSPFVNLTAEHDFIGSGRTLITTQVTTPLLPVLTPIDSRGRTYGKVAAGVSVLITDKVSATLNAVSTFARADGNDFGVSGGVKVAF